MAASSNRRYLCGVPKNSCCGIETQATNGLGKVIKTHASSLEAFNCHAKYLLSKNFKQIGQREFVDPETGYVRVLTKKCRFGGVCRPGKRGDTAAVGSRRVVSKRRGNHGGVAGQIISC
jgi:hypothetical protein